MVMTQIIHCSRLLMGKSHTMDFLCEQFRIPRVWTELVWDDYVATVPLFRNYSLIATSYHGLNNIIWPQPANEDHADEQPANQDQKEFILTQIKRCSKLFMAKFQTITFLYDQFRIPIQWTTMVWNDYMDTCSYFRHYDQLATTYHSMNESIWPKLLHADEDDRVDDTVATGGRADETGVNFINGNANDP